MNEVSHPTSKNQSPQLEAIKQALDAAAIALSVLFNMCMAAKLRAGAMAADEILGSVKFAQKEMAHLLSEANSAPETSGGWRPIETVPRDVKVLTLRWSMGDKRPLIDTATLERHGQATGLHHGNGVFFCKVTHWMPLPEPPLKASDEPG